MPIKQTPSTQHDEASVSAGPMAVGRSIGSEEIDPGIASRFHKYIDHPFVFSWKGDTFVFAPFNHGTLDASKYHKGSGDLYVFVPGNMGTVTAEDHDTKSVRDIDKTIFGNVHAKAEVSLDSDVFIYAPNNKGKIHGEASADAKAYAEAVSKFGNARADAEATADAHVLIYNPNNKGQVTADVEADATALALANGYKSAATSADALAHTSAEITSDPSVLKQFKLLSMMAGQGHLLDAWI